MKGFQPALVFAGVVVLHARGEPADPGREDGRPAQCRGSGDDTEPVPAEIVNRVTVPERQLPGLKTMSATTTVSTTRSMRDDLAKIRLIRPLDLGIGRDRGRAASFAQSLRLRPRESGAGGGRGRDTERARPSTQVSVKFRR